MPLGLHLVCSGSGRLGHVLKSHLGNLALSFEPDSGPSTRQTDVTQHDYTLEFHLLTEHESGSEGEGSHPGNIIVLGSVSRYYYTDHIYALCIIVMLFLLCQPLCH